MVMAHPSMCGSNHGILEQFARRCNAPLVWMEDTEQINIVEGDEDLQRGLEMSREDEELRQALEMSRIESQEISSPKCFDVEDTDLMQALEESCRAAEEERCW